MVKVDFYFNILCSGYDTLASLDTKGERPYCSDDWLICRGSERVCQRSLVLKVVSTHPSRPNRSWTQPVLITLGNFETPLDNNPMVILHVVSLAQSYLSAMVIQPFLANLKHTIMLLKKKLCYSVKMASALQENIRRLIFMYEQRNWCVMSASFYSCIIDL